MFIGGTGAKYDDSLKINCDSVKTDKGCLITWNNIIIDSPFKDNIQSVSLEFCAGEVANLHIRYYRNDAQSRLDSGKDPTWGETFLISKLKLELQSSKRIFHADGVHLEDGTELDEASRSKILGTTPT